MLVRQCCSCTTSRATRGFSLTLILRDSLHLAWSALGEPQQLARLHRLQRFGILPFVFLRPEVAAAAHKARETKGTFRFAAGTKQLVQE